MRPGRATRGAAGGYRSGLSGQIRHDSTFSLNSGFPVQNWEVVPVPPPHPWVDTRLYPILVIEFPEVAPAADVRSMTIALRRFANELTESIALVSDLSRIRVSDPESRSIYVEFVRDMRKTAGHRVRGTAVITRSGVQRTIMNLHAMLVGQTPYPVRGFATRAEALPWLRARLGSTL